MKPKFSYNDIMAAGVVLYIILLVFWEFVPTIPFIGIKLSGILKIFLFLCLIFLLLTRKKKLALKLNQNIVIGGLFVMSVLSLVTVGNISFAMHGIMMFLNILFVYFLIIHFIDKEKYIKWVLIALVFLAVVHSFFIFFSCYSGIGISVSSNCSTFRPELLTNANFAAAMLNSVIPICFYLMKSTKSRINKTALLIALFFISTAILMTFSRSGMLAMGFVLATLLLIHFPKKIKAVKNSPYFILIVLLLVFIPVFFISNVAHNGNIMSGQCKRPYFHDYYEERVQILDSGINMVGGNFFLGVGINNFRASINDYNGEYVGNIWKVEDRHSHNTYLDFLSELGIFGFLLFVILAYMTIHTFYRSKSYFSGALLISFMSILISCLFLGIGMNYLLWIPVGLAVALEKIQSKKKLK